MGLVKCARSDCCFCRAKSPPSRRCSPTPLPRETPCGARSQQGLGVLGARSRVSAGLRRSKDGEGSVLEKLCSETLLAFGR